MKSVLLASAAVLALSTAAFAQSRDTIQIAGSSTVLPFASIVAEEFSAAFPEFNTPVVGSGGTGGGFSQFCQGVGDNTIDIANASRPIRDGEREACDDRVKPRLVQQRHTDRRIHRGDRVGRPICEHKSGGTACQAVAGDGGASACFASAAKGAQGGSGGCSAAGPRPLMDPRDEPSGPLATFGAFALLAARALARLRSRRACVDARFRTGRGEP